MNQKGFATLAIILIVVALLVVGGIWYYESHKVATTQTMPSTIVNTNTPSASSTSPTSTPIQSISTSSPSIGSGQLHNEVSFLRNGEVWLMDTNTQKLTQLTDASGTVQSYAFSPTQEYLAYQTKSPNSIVIERTSDKSVVGTISDSELPEGGQNSYLYGWKSDDTISFEVDQPGNYIGVFQYNLAENTTTALNFNDWGLSTQEADLVYYSFAPDMSFMAYADGRQLHVIQSSTLQDKLLYTSTGVDGLLFMPSVSYDKNQIAFDQKSEEASSTGAQYFDNLMVYNLQDATATLLYTTPPNLGLDESSYTLWSPDDRYIIISLEKGSFLVDTQNLSLTVPLSGGDFNWYGNQIMFSNNGNIYLVNPTATSQEQLFISNASEAQYFP
jgi:Tol biopolymer transport system component